MVPGNLPSQLEILSTGQTYYDTSNLHMEQIAKCGRHNSFFQVPAFVPYSVTAGCSLTGNTHELLPMLCCLTVSPFDPGIFPRATIVLLGICY